MKSNKLFINLIIFIRIQIVSNKCTWDFQLYRVFIYCVSIVESREMDKNNSENILSTKNIRALVTPREVETILYDDYGLEVEKITELNGYDDKNFLIKAKNLNGNKYIDGVCENGYVFKVINSLDSLELNFFKAQDSALIYLGECNVDLNGT